MKIHVSDDASLREVLEALVALPIEARRLAVEHMVIAGTGLSAAGLAIGPSALGDSSWVVPLLERPGIGATLAHEVAHAWLAHDGRAACADDERAAAALAAEWGFKGPAADADGCAARFEAARQAGRALMRATVADGTVSVECRCGAACRVLAPTVPGLDAEVGVACDACGWTTVEDVARLAPCSACGARATALWTAAATPEAPLVRQVCSCGATALLRLSVEAPDVVPAVDEPEERMALRLAVRSLARLEANLRRPGLSAEASPESIASAVGGLWFARKHLRRAAALLGTDLDARAAAAGAGLRRGDFAGAADTLADVAAALSALLTTAP